MISESQEIGSGRNLSARSPEVDFALVLSRVIGSIEDDPAQLRNAVYELARIKLRQEAWRRKGPVNLLEARRLSLALESAIERVETIHSKHDELRALQSLDRLIQSSEIAASEVMVEPRTPLLIINQAPAQRKDADHLSAVFLTCANDTWLNIKRSLRWRGTAPLLRGAMVAIFAVTLCVVFDRQFGLLERQAPHSAAPVVQKSASLEPKPAGQARGELSSRQQLCCRRNLHHSRSPTFMAFMPSAEASSTSWSPWPVECPTKGFSCRRRSGQ